MADDKSCVLSVLENVADEKSYVLSALENVTGEKSLSIILSVLERLAGDKPDVLSFSENVSGEKSGIQIISENATDCVKSVSVPLGLVRLRLVKSSAVAPSAARPTQIFCSNGRPLLSVCTLSDHYLVFRETGLCVGIGRVQKKIANVASNTAFGHVVGATVGDRGDARLLRYA